MVLKKTQERVKTLLKDTITLLCKNGLEFKTKFNIEALIGVTLDDDEVFLISMNELIRSDAIAEHEQPNDADDAAPDTTTKPSAKKRRRRSLNSDDGVRVKLEPGIQPPSDTPEEDFWAADDPQSPSGMLGDDSNNYDQPPNPAKRQHTDDSTHRLKSEELEDEDSEDIVIVKEEGRDCFSDFQSPSFPSFQPSQPGGSGWSPAVGYSGYQQSSASSATITSDQSVLNQASPGQQYPRQQTSQGTCKEKYNLRGHQLCSYQEDVLSDSESIGDEFAPKFDVLLPYAEKDKMQSPEQFIEERRRRDRLLKRKYRASMTPSQKQKANENAKLRVRKYRMRLKEKKLMQQDDIESGKSSVKHYEYETLSLEQKEDVRKKWRMAKQKTREKLTATQKEEEKQKRREKYAKMKCTERTGN